MRRLVAGVCLCGLLGSVGRVAAEDPPSTDDADGYHYYVASVAAAGALLRLHEVDAVHWWLEQAPPAHRGWEWRYLRAESDRSAEAFDATQGTVTDLSVSPDGEWLAVAGGTEVSLWSTRSGRRVGELSGHAKTVWNARFSPDGGRLATVSSDGTLRVWRLEDRQEVLRVDDVGSGVAGVAWHPAGERLATVSWRRTEERGVWGVIDVWDAEGRRVEHFDHGVKPLTSVSFSADGARLFVGSWDFEVAVFDLGEDQRLAAWLPPDDGVYKAVRESRLAPDGSLLAAGHDDGAVRVWDVASGSLLRVLHRQAEGAYLAQNDVAWFADGRRLAAASADRTVRIWDVRSGEHLQALHGHLQPVTALALTPDQTTLFSGDASGEIRRWDLASAAPARSTWQLPAVGYSVAVSHDGRRVASTGWGGWVVIVDSETGREIVRWQGHDTSGVRAAWSPGDSLLATTGNDDLVKVWELSTQASSQPPTDNPKLRFELPVGMQSLAVGFSADGALLASPADGTSVRVWSTKDGGLVAELGEDAEFTDLDWHPANALLAAAGADGVVRLWRPASEATPTRLEGQGEGEMQVAFSHGGDRLAAVSASGTIRIWDLASQSIVREMSAASSLLLAVAWSPDDARLATGGRDDRVHLWDPVLGTSLLEVPFSASPWDVAWSRDGASLLVIPLDGTIRVLRSGR